MRNVVRAPSDFGVEQQLNEKCDPSVSDYELQLRQRPSAAARLASVAKPLKRNQRDEVFQAKIKTFLIAVNGRSFQFKGLQIPTPFLYPFPRPPDLHLPRGENVERCRINRRGYGRGIPEAPL